MTKPLEAMINRAKHIIKNDGLLARDTSLLLIAALEQSQQYAKDRDAENQGLMLTVGRLREEVESHIKEIVEEGEKIRGLNETLRGMEDALVSQLELEQLREQRKSWKQIAQTNISEREKDIAELGAARKRIAELEKYAEAEASGADETADNVLYWMRRCKKLEARKLAVKLPTPATPLDAAAAIRACMDEFPEAVQDIVEECAVIAENTVRPSGGTVQGDE